MMNIESKILSLYHEDDYRDDDCQRWNGSIAAQPFTDWKQALGTKDENRVNELLTHHHEDPVLSCTYDHEWNATRWWYGSNLVINQTSDTDVVVEIGPGSHATVAGHVLQSRYSTVKCYILCDLVSPLLLAYYNLSKDHDVHYVTPGDNLETLITQHKCILLPHHLSNKLYTLSGAVYYNSYSFSEMSEDEIHHYMDIIMTTRSRLLSENYMTGNGACHLCGIKYRALNSHLPKQLNILARFKPPTPTNAGSEVIIAQS